MVGVSAKNRLPHGQPIEEVTVLGKTIPIFIRGNGNIPLLVLGQSSLFKKPNFIPTALDQYFTLYFVDLFETPEISHERLTHLQLDTFTEAYEQIRLQLGLNKVALFAHSACGILSIEYEKKYKNNVIFSIIVAMAPIWGEHKKELVSSYFSNNASKERQEIFTDDQKAANPKSNFAQTYNLRRAHFYYTPLKPSWLRLWDGVTHDERLINRYFDLIQHYDVSQNMVVDIPTFLALGLYDYSNPFYAWTDELTAASPYMMVHIFEKSGHYPTLEEPELFNEQLLNFVRVFMPKIAPLPKPNTAQQSFGFYGSR